MAERSLAILTLIAALGSAVSGGVLFAFSTFVMAALARLPAQQGIAAMQAINVTVINVPFMATFFGTGVVCLVLSVAVVVQRGWSGGLVVAASLLYVLGCLAVTMAFNVPLNEALAKIGEHSPEANSFWSMYQRVWTLWNHLRTVAAVAASLALMWALRQETPTMPAL